MRSFLATHWKTIVALIILVLLAIFVMPAGSARPGLAARLHAHVDALATSAQGPDELDAAARYVATTLAADGYRIARQRYRQEGRAVDKIEAWRAGPHGGRRAARTFLLGTRYGAIDEDERTSAAAMLELARLLKSLHPAPGTEVRFVFLFGRTRIDAGPAAGFVAWSGPRAASGPIGQALAAFRNVPDIAGGPFTTPAWVQGVTISAPHAAAAPGERTMLIADTAFQSSPCKPAAHNAAGPDYDEVARVVRQLAQSVTVLASLASS